ncbi:MAG: AAA family ATPase [Gemmatimonadetes bacterium]|nr:AAA family ATPase [Gemmatimonadota bacterium]
MSPLPPVQGHAAVRAALGRAVRHRDLPGSLLFHGPPGVGKQRTALWLAQLLACADTRALEPCGTCHPCRLALGLTHPDVHWFFPLPRPRHGGSIEKLAETLEEARATELAARRADPLRATAPGEPVGLFFAQVRTIRRMATARPVLGRKVFVIGEAELLVPQEASQEAANALLKLLEEPPRDTSFVLTSADPDALLPTIRSRLLPVRFRPVAYEDVTRFLIEQRGVAAERAALVARLAQGSIGRALGFLPAEDGEPGPLEALRIQARQLLEAALAASPLPRLSAAHSTPASRARGAFGDLLDALALWVRDLAATAAQAEGQVVNADAQTLLRELAARLHRPPAAGAPAALRAIDAARYLGRLNVNPQLTLAWLLRSLHQQLANAAPLADLPD